MGFDLIIKSWIPVLRADRAPDERNLRDVLCEAHMLSALRDPLPTVEFGLYRLLGALVLDIFFVEPGAPFDTKALGDLLQAGRFDPATVDAYFAKYADRFDLFHPKYPFLQTAGMDADAPKPLAGLLHPQPSGTNIAHFRHGHEGKFGVSPAVAARLLTTIAPFMTAGGAGLSPSINGAPPWYVLVEGENLFETLCLNVCAVPLSEVTGTEPPAWRSGKAVGGGGRTTACSYPEALTWRPRRIQLIPGEGGRCALTGEESSVLVRAMKFAPGASCDFAWRDPNVPYKVTKDGPLVLRPQEERAVWRDTGPLALLQARDFSGEEPVRFERPRLVDQFAQLVQDGVLKKGLPLRLTVYGLRTDLKMKVFEWHKERLTPVPAPLLWQTDLHRTAQQEMERAGSAAYEVGRAIKRMYPRDANGNKSGFDVLIGQAQRQFWAALRSDYEALLERIAPLEPDEDDEAVAAAREAWHQRVRTVARDTLSAAIDDLDTDARAIERQVRTRRLFFAALANLFATEEQRAARVNRRRSNATPATTTA